MACAVSGGLDRIVQLRSLSDRSGLDSLSLGLGGALGRPDLTDRGIGQLGENRGDRLKVGDHVTLDLAVGLGDRVRAVLTEDGESRIDALDLLALLGDIQLVASLQVEVLGEPLLRLDTQAKGLGVRIEGGAEVDPSRSLLLSLRLELLLGGSVLRIHHGASGLGLGRVVHGNLVVGGLGGDDGLGGGGLGVHVGHLIFSSDFEFELLSVSSKIAGCLFDKKIILQLILKVHF